MRTEQEILYLKSVLVRLSKSFLPYIESGDASISEEAMGCFNDNAKMICALDWVLEQDTIVLSEAGE